MSVQSIEEHRNAQSQEIEFLSTEEYVRRKRKEIAALSARMNYHLQAILDRRVEVLKAVEKVDEVEAKYNSFLERSN